MVVSKLSPLTALNILAIEKTVYVDKMEDKLDVDTFLYAEND